MKLLIVRSYPTGPRCWLVGQRIHHGASALVAAALLRHHRRLAAACLLAVAHDRHDWRRWFAREKPPAPTVDNPDHTGDDGALCLG